MNDLFNSSFPNISKGTYVYAPTMCPAFRSGFFCLSFTTFGMMWIETSRQVQYICNSFITAVAKKKRLCNNYSLRGSEECEM